MVQNNLTQDEMILELISLLKKNGMSEKANDVFESASYVDLLGQKLEQMTEELSEVRKQLQEMQDKTFVDTIKKSLSNMAIKMENRCKEIKVTLIEVKDDMKAKAVEILHAVKWKGKEVLNKVSEFIRLKGKLEFIREKIRKGITDTDRSITKIEAFGAGMREAGQVVANTFRTFADKPIVDYSEKEESFSKLETLKKPWKWQKKIYQSMELYLAAAINKVENLSMDVKMYDIEKQCNELYYKTYVVDAEAKGDIVSGVEEQKQDYHANEVINSRGR